MNSKGLFMVLLISIILFAVSCNESDKNKELYSTDFTTIETTTEKITTTSTTKATTTTTTTTTIITTTEKKPDFFSYDDNKQRFKELSNKAQYKELYDYIKDYTETNDIGDNDYAYRIINILEPVMPYIEEAYIDYDELRVDSDKCRIYYSGVQELSSETHVVPYIKPYHGEISLNVGFTDYDWLFFDTVIITGEKGKWKWYGSVDSSDRIEKVLDDGLISERAVERAYDDEDLIDISKNKDAIIRFSNNKTEEKREYNLTDSEKKALDFVTHFSSIDDDLYNILDEYREESGDWS